MNLWLYSAGMSLAVVIAYDVMKTTLALSGGGPLTGRLARLLWKLALGLSRIAESRRPLARGATGILLGTVSLWVVGLFTGYTLMFCSTADAVLRSTDNVPADLTSRLYFTGFTLFTLGIGDYVPGAGGWQILTAVASLHGLCTLTLAITYLLPVLSAGVEKRALAGLMHGMGETPREVLANAWNGENFQGAESFLNQLAPMLEVHMQRHLAYPVLHYFPARAPDHREHVVRIGVDLERGVSRRNAMQSTPLKPGNLFVIHRRMRRGKRPGVTSDS